MTLEDLKSQNVISNSVDEEINERLTSQIAILKNGRGQHRKFLPHVFTRNGIGMLSSVLKSGIAVDVNLVDLKKHNEQYREIKFLQLPQKNHDRFLIGASVKDMGAGMCAVTKMAVSPELILGLLRK